MKNIIGLKELRKNVSSYVARVEKGDSFIVVKRSKPIFKISPPDEEGGGDWETVVDFTELSKDGIPAKDLLRKLKASR